MDSTIQSLGGILLKAIPTLILLIFLNIYLKFIFFKPLAEVLRKRREATEGAREAAESGLKSASDRASEYEAKLRDARAEIYREQEETRRRWLDVQARELSAARENTQELVRNAKNQLQQDAAVAKRDLSATSEALAEQISQSLLQRRAG